MSKLLIQQFCEFSDEHIELYWLAGIESNEKSAWFVRAVVRGMSSGRFYMRSLPIGMLPLLSLSRIFFGGKLLTLPARGVIETVTISDVSQYEEITSADIPPELYSFEGHSGGVQRLFRYNTAQGEILIPAIELIRYLFLHNRTIANALMRPGAINLLFHPEAPGYYPELVLRFTAELPKHCLSHQFAQEFAWIALDPDARRAWDSVYLQSQGQQYVSFVPPALKNSIWNFRGVRHGDRWLVLELIHLTGKRHPCEKLRYGHPSLKQIVHDSDGKFNGASNEDGKDAGTPLEQIIYDYQLDDGQAGSKSNSGEKVVDIYSKRSDFDHDIKVEKLLTDVNRPAGTRPQVADQSGPKSEKRQIIKVSVGERASNATLPPLDFKLLTLASWDRLGDLKALADTVQHMKAKLPKANFAMALCYIKSGRVFSIANRRPRVALVVTILMPDVSQIVLLDVERTGEIALSLIALRFKNNQPFMILENSVKQMLDGLVDASGHWDHQVEQTLSRVCTCERLPKMLTPRAGADMPGRTAVWAMKLLHRLGIKNPTNQ